MEAAIKTAVAALLLFAAALMIIVLVRSGFEGGFGAGSSSQAGEGATGKKRLFRRGGLSFRSRAAKKQEAAEAPPDPRHRFLIIGGVFSAVLVTLLVKLWTMQVISSKTYTRLAEANAKTTYTIRAPRGRILDRNGNVLVDNRSTLAVIASPEVAKDKNTMRRLSVVLGIPYAAVRQRVTSTAAGVQADRVVAQDVSQRAVAFISEHPGTFPHVYVDSRTVRTYPNGTLAAHVLGYTGTISEEELKAAEERGEDASVVYESGDIVGKAGAEYEFESVLQGVKGERTVEVDASGRVVSLIEEIAPQIGNDVRLTIDIEVQRAAEQALQEALERAHSTIYKNANAGAIVCLDVETGGVVAMASVPTFDPAQFVGGISTNLWAEMTNEESGYPLTNRAISGQYPAASTFKAFTGMAGLEYGYCDDKSKVECTGRWEGFGKDWPQMCWEHAGHGEINFVEGIVESCDVVFYEIAREFYRNADTVGLTAMQDYVRQWGFGAKTGIDLPGETSGRIPTPEWKKEFNRDVPESAQWVPGDYSNFVIGQGDLLVTPLQICQGYMCIAGDGTCATPHIFKDVLSRDGKVLIENKGKTTIQPAFQQKNLDLVKEGLAAVVSRGHVMELFAEMEDATAGKTGTGEVAGKDDYGWYVGYGPVEKPKYCCACVIEQGGGGSTVAAPAVRLVLATAMGDATTFATNVVEDNSR